ncbi:DUF4105 domain-containing protein [Aquabacterium sp. NJ1]|uniref:Lnb N-terminal periplasmic domain-containing protein n=1 Tax=Aquabacterium sp. NJ1 TaxID=1538295 RepID=UPI0009DE6C55|nr:DUF4105 domain-containing protein [Aquabacterium sp. NJ1]
MYSFVPIWMRLLITAALCCLYSASTRADIGNAPTTQGIALQALAQDPTWLKLGHYEPASDSPSGWRSAIHTETFFLNSRDGRDSPLSELQATLDALRLPADAKPDDEHAQCRFPARTLWLKKKLAGQLNFPSVSCPRWDAWAGSRQITSISLVLASGFLGNPASYYGHTLLKFNTDPSRRLTALQDLSISYGVIEDGSDSPFVYIVKGILGGYDGGFSDIEYYFHRNQYGEIELRDLWEYEINLSPDEVQFVSAHAWEVLNRRYQYFFFRKNCAFRMAEIVQIVEGVNITPPNRPWTIPQATLQQAGRERRADGSPLLKSVRYAPSRQSRFYASFNALGAQERQVFFDLVAHEQALTQAPYRALPPEGQRAVVDATIDYYQFITDAAQRSSGKLHPVYTAALAERFRLPPAPKTAEAVAPQAPHLGRAPGWFQAGWMDSDRQGQAGFVRIRAAYYDPLDSDQGHVPYSGLTMGDLRLRFKQQGIRLDQLDLVAINSANPGVTGLAGDRGQVWQIKVGAEPVKPGCEDCLAAKLQGDIGMGRRLMSGLFLAVRAGGAVQGKRADQGLGYVKAGTTLIWRPNPDWGTEINMESRWPAGSEQARYNVLKAEWRYALGRSYDIRIQHEHSSGEHGGARTLLGIGRYW